MNKSVVKNIIILSMILGLVLGLLAPIPIVGMVMLCSIMILTAPLIIVYMIMDGKYELTIVKDSIIAGALSGFVSNFAFSISYAVIAAILAKIFHYTTNFFLTAMIINSPIWLLLIFIIFIGVLCATTNAFSGFVTHYAIEFMRDMYEKKTK